MQFTEEVFKQKAIEEALTLLKENGFEVPEPITKVSKSRTSSEMLFGEKVSGNKKRDGKATDKDDMSVASGKTSKSKAKIGEYPC